MIAFIIFLSLMAQADIQLDKIKLPKGFEISVFNDKVKGARSMTWGAKGTLFVGTQGSGQVYAITSDNHVHVLAKDLNQPNGVAFKNGNLYVAEINRILRFDKIEEHLDDPPKYKVLNDTYPKDEHHGWKFIAFGPDGRLYVPVGAPCNVCEPKEPYASLTTLDDEGKNRQIYARGIRNTVGFDWDPRNHKLWFTDNGRDMLGDDIPSDELNYAPHAGMNFGFPYCHQGDLPDPEFGKRKSCSQFVPPEQKLGPHVANLGMRFYTGAMFPPEYKNQIFVAEHGSWNRTTPIGYRVALVRMGANGHSKSNEIFAEGWLQGGVPWGRPVDVVVAPDGALLVSDDMAGAIYRISYKK